MREHRTNEQTRKISIKKDIMKNAFASVEVRFGDTRVFCTASVDDNPPKYAVEEGKGWLTAEYNMLPASTNSRKRRNVGKQDGRTVEIQRLIGRSLRASIDLEKIQGYSIIIDCDVIEADGGTRTASITGGFVALRLACERMLAEGMISETPLQFQIASISAGKVDGQLMVDLDYIEDSSAEVDYNVVMNERGEFIELQGTAEHGVMTRDDLNEILRLCDKSLQEIFELQLSACK